MQTGIPKESLVLLGYLFVSVILFTITFSDSAYPISRFIMFSDRPDVVCNTLLFDNSGVIPSDDMSRVLEVSQLVHRNFTTVDAAKTCSEIRASSLVSLTDVAFQVKEICHSFGDSGSMIKEEKVLLRC